MRLKEVLDDAPFSVIFTHVRGHSNSEENQKAHVS
jgi:hypothetical protein